MLLIALRAGASRFRSRFGTAAAALIVAAALALPGAAAASSTRLFDDAVSPRAGTTSTVFQFAVTYRNREGSAPNEVVVVIDGVRHAMRQAASNDWKSGVRFTFATRLANGRHSVAFHSLGRDRFVDDIDAGTVTVGAAPRPRPTPTPARDPNRAPSTEPPSPPNAPDGPGSVPPPASGGFTGSETGGVGGSPASDGASIGGAGMPDPAAGDSTGDAMAAGRTAGLPSSAAHVGPSASNVEGAALPGERSGASWGDLAAYLEALSRGGWTMHQVPLSLAIVWTAGAAAVCMAFMFFGKRRRDGEPPEPDEVLSAAAARGTGQVADATLVPDRPAPPGVPEDEIGLPRWRRPSLLEARKKDPSRSAPGIAAPLTFARGAAGLADGHERRLIRYHVVRLLDAPDELRGEEIGILAHDDEVQLVERSGSYWRVLCPDGRQGWIHKMTLGDVVGEPPSPGARDVWGNPIAQPDDIDDDVLTAFMTARSRA